MSDPPRVEAVAPEHLPSLVALFEACNSSCYCRYWHFEGDKNAWLERCAFSPETNRDELCADVRAGAARARGLVALEGADVIGWMKLAPRAELPKLRRLPVYRALDLGPDEGVWSVGCILVHPACRSQGVALALARSAALHARRAGAVVEAYPLRVEGRVRDEEAWRGTDTLFLKASFSPVNADVNVAAHTNDPSSWAAQTTALYPVLRSR